MPRSFFGIKTDRSENQSPRRFADQRRNFLLGNEAHQTGTRFSAVLERRRGDSRARGNGVRFGGRARLYGGCVLGIHRPRQGHGHPQYRRAELSAPRQSGIGNGGRNRSRFRFVLGERQREYFFRNRTDRAVGEKHFYTAFAFSKPFDGRLHRVRAGYFGGREI